MQKDPLKNSLTYMNADGLKIGGDKVRITKLQEAIIKLTGTDYITDGKPTGKWGAQTGRALVEAFGYDGAAISEKQYNDILSGNVNIKENDASGEQPDIDSVKTAAQATKMTKSANPNLYDKFSNNDGDEEEAEDKKPKKKEDNGSGKDKILGMAPGLFWTITATLSLAAMATVIWHWEKNNN